MEQKNSSDKRFALLIDADNVSSKYIGVILDELSNYGIITYKRIYGDWTSTLHAKWKDTLLENSITPIQQFSYTTGKNATDSALIIDAMDIMYTKTVDGFCLVSSDSDFTRLAARIREAGLMVIGAGENKTPLPFRTACDVFKCLEVLLGEDDNKNDAAKQKNGHNTQNAELLLSRKKIEKTIIDIVTNNLNKERETGLGEIGSRLVKRYPDFDVRNYGTNQLSKLLAEFSSIKLVSSGKTMLVELADTHSNKQHHTQAATKLKLVATSNARTVQTTTAHQKQQAASNATSAPKAPKPAHQTQQRKEESANAQHTTNAELKTSNESNENTSASAHATRVTHTTNTTNDKQTNDTVTSTSSASRKAKAPALTHASKAKESHAKTSNNTSKVARLSHTIDDSHQREARPHTNKALPRAVAKTRSTDTTLTHPNTTQQPSISAQTPLQTAAFPSLDALSAHITTLIAEHKNATISVPALGKLIRTSIPNFEPKAYSYSKLSDLLAHISTIELVHKNKSIFATIRANNQE